MNKNLLEGTPTLKFAFPNGFTLEAKKTVVAKNEVFRTMLLSNMAESETGKVNIKDCDPTVLNMFLKYLETGRVETADEDDLMDLLEIADKYLDDGLKAICENGLCRLLDRFNALEMFTTAITRNCEQLKKTACVFVRNDLDYFINTPKFDDLCHNAVAVKMLLMNPINCPPSYKYFEPVGGMKAVTKGRCTFQLQKPCIPKQFDFKDPRNNRINYSGHFLANDLVWIAVLVIEKVHDKSSATINEYELVLTIFSQISHIVSCSADVEIILKSTRENVDSVHKILRGILICKRNTVLYPSYEPNYTYKIHDVQNHIRSEPTAIIAYNDLYGLCHSLTNYGDGLNIEVKFTFNNIVRK